MDITSTATNITSSPEAQRETPIKIQPIKPLPFSNGVLKRHHHHLQHHHQVIIPSTTTTTTTTTTYKECLKNHAATLGAHALDGCGEFMPSPTATPSDPTSLKCAACGCHRNFHRREPDPTTATTTATATHAIEYQSHHRHHPPPPPPLQPNRSPNSASPPPISSSYYPSAPHMLLALSTGPGPGPSPINGSSNARKRFRTKFSQDQKERMHEFAERVGWKMQKRDEEIVQEFCHEVGVDKGVLKVWMHNNKNTLGKVSSMNNMKDVNNHHLHHNVLEHNSSSHNDDINGKNDAVQNRSTNHEYEDDEDNDEVDPDQEGVLPAIVAANGSSSSS